MSLSKNESSMQNVNTTTSTITNTSSDNNDATDGALDQLWINIMNEISTMESPASSKNLPFIPAHVKKVMKTVDVALQKLKQIAEDNKTNSSHSRNHHNNNNNDIHSSQMDDTESKKPPRKKRRHIHSKEVPFVMAMASEMLIRDLTLRAWIHTKKNTIKKSDIIHATRDTDMYDFLLDL